MRIKFSLPSFRNWMEVLFGWNAKNKCPECNGNGWLAVAYRGASESQVIAMGGSTCSECSGTGRVSA